MKHKKIALALAGLLLTSNANADITFNGFANIVAGATTASDETLYGFDNNIDFSNGSLFALQASSDLGEGLSVTTQILSRGADDWDPKFEWAYVAYQANDNLRLLAGRQRVPFYMFSDFLDVSYAYAWIAPPAGVYNVVFDTFDGLAAIYNTTVGDFDTTLHVIYGSNDSELPNDIPADFNDLTGVALTVNKDWLTLRAAYFQAEVNLDVDLYTPLLDGWRSTPFAGVADEIEASGDTGVFVELGFQFDFDNVIVIGEFTRLTNDGTAFGDEDSYYVMAGYRFNDMLVHATYGGNDDSKNRITGGVPVGASAGLDGLIAATNGLTDSQSTEVNYITLGLRWNLHDSAALKFEYTSYSDDLNNSNDAGLFRTALVTVF